MASSPLPVPFLRAATPSLGASPDSRRGPHSYCIFQPGSSVGSLEILDIVVVVGAWSYSQGQTIALACLLQ